MSWDATSVAFKLFATGGLALIVGFMLGLSGLPIGIGIGATLLGICWVGAALLYIWAA